MWIETASSGDQHTFRCVTFEDSISGPTERRASQGPASLAVTFGEQGALSPSQSTALVVVFETLTVGLLSLVLPS